MFKTLSLLLAFTQAAPADPIIFGAAPDLPEFTIDLDAPAKDRFKEPVTHFREGIITTFKLYMEQVPQPVHTLFDGISWLWWYSQSEKYAEVEGMVAVLNDPDITVPKTVLVNSLYELESWCTSIIAR